MRFKFVASLMCKFLNDKSTNISFSNSVMALLLRNSKLKCLSLVFKLLLIRENNVLKLKKSFPPQKKLSLSHMHGSTISTGGHVLCDSPIIIEHNSSKATKLQINYNFNSHNIESEFQSLLTFQYIRHCSTNLIFCTHKLNFAYL